MRIADVLRNKGGAVATITPETSVSDLLTELAEHNIGAMVVVSAEGLVGIVSERDVVRKLHEHGADLLELPVSEIMTTMVATCAPSDTVNHLNAVMTTKRVRHIPVLENGRAGRHRQHRRRGQAADGRDGDRAAGAAGLHHAWLRSNYGPPGGPTFARCQKCWPGRSTTIR